MKHLLSDNVWKVLVCPYCEKILTKIEKGAKCNYCQLVYEYTSSGSLDLRLQRIKKSHYEFDLEGGLPPCPDFNFQVLLDNANPEVDFSNVDVPYHLSREMISYFPKAKSPDSLMLDIGCGNAIHREICKHAGFEYVGLDFDSANAPILGDAHSLPFKDESFEFIISIAVLEHIRFPFVKMKEAYRVLKPTGKFIGTVAFLEPFHGNSYYHHTHLGVYNSLNEGGFKVEYIAPSTKWVVLLAHAGMLFPKMPSFLSKLLMMPLQLLHRLWWGIGSIWKKKDLGNIRLISTTGSFTFIARRYETEK